MPQHHPYGISCSHNSASLLFSTSHTTPYYKKIFKKFGKMSHRLQDDDKKISLNIKNKPLSPNPWYVTNCQRIKISVDGFCFHLALRYRAKRTNVFLKLDNGSLITDRYLMSTTVKDLQPDINAAQLCLGFTKPRIMLLLITRWAWLPPVRLWQ